MKKRLLCIIMSLVFIPYMTMQVFAEQWQLVPMVTQAIKDAGNTGGEGGQWEQAIACDPVDGTFLLSGTDVGAIFRSIDGGEQWEPANAGYYARGNCGFAIDPNNTNRVLAIGANSIEDPSNGIYLSTDKGATWQQVLSRNIQSMRDFREQVAFDKSSYSSAIGGSSVAYWSSMSYSGDSTGRLFKSTNGGVTWSEIPNSAAYGKSIVKVHPTAGYVYIANSNGFYKSTNGGTSFTLKYSGNITGLDVVNSNPDYVFISKPDGVYRSADSGESFVKMTNTGFPAASGKAKWLKVSPADINKMLVCEDTDGYNKLVYYSANGGNNWYQSAMDTAANLFIPWNNRQQMFSWHPTDSSVVWSLGGDFVTKSTDSGASFRWYHNGNTGIMTGGLWNFTTTNPDIIYFASQDYNGAISTDRGSTWKYVNIAQLSWGGFAYGGYAKDANTAFAGVADSWGGQRKLKVARNIQGNMTVTDTGKVYGGLDAAYGDPADSNILFASNFRSTDGGYNWTAMNNCKGVITHNPAGTKELYGIYNNTIVKSTDKGATWTTIYTLSGNVEDIAYDHVNNAVYAVAGNNLYRCQGTVTNLTGNIPLNQRNERRLNTVAVDPQDVSVIYAGGPGNIYMNDSSVIRSTNGGTTWEVLTRNTRNSVTSGMGSGYEASCIRVHPVTRELFVATGCFGWAKIGPPGTSIPTPVPTPASTPTPTPTPTPSPDGGTYTEDFNDNQAQNWSLSANVSVSGSKMSATGWIASTNAVYDGQTFNPAYNYKADMYNYGGAGANITRVVFNYSDNNNYYYVEFGGGASGTAVLKKKVGGTVSAIATYGTYATQNLWVTVDVTYASNSITVKATKSGVQTTLFNNVSDSSLTSGKIGFMTEWNNADFDNVTVSY